MGTSGPVLNSARAGLGEAGVTIANLLRGYLESLVGSAALCSSPTTAAFPASSRSRPVQPSCWLQCLSWWDGLVTFPDPCQAPSDLDPMVALTLASVTESPCPGEATPRCCSPCTPYWWLCYGCSRETPGVPNVTAQAKLCQPCCALENRLDNVTCSAGGQEQGWEQDSTAPGERATLVAGGTAHLPVNSACSGGFSLLVVSPAAQRRSCLPEPLQAHGAATPAVLAGAGVGCPCPPPVAAHARAVLSPVPVGRDCRDVPSPLTRHRAGCRPRAGRQEPFGSRKLQGRKTGLGETWGAG